MSTRLASAAFACALALACIATAARAQERQLPVAIGISAIEGSRVPEQCHWPRPPEDPARSGCIIFPTRIGMQVQRGVLSNLDAAGWEFVSGAANVFWLNRPIANADCVDRLYVMGWVDAELAEAQRMLRSNTPPENQVFLFMMKAEPLCGDRRQDE
ncbi:MAG: hypothetical protein ABL932_01470 [Terricaulis sp.]